MADPTVLQLIHEDVQHTRKKIDDLDTKFSALATELVTVSGDVEKVKAKAHSPNECPMRVRWVWLTGVAAGVGVVFAVLFKLWAALERYVVAP